MHSKVLQFSYHFFPALISAKWRASEGWFHAVFILVDVAGGSNVQRSAGQVSGEVVVLGLNEFDKRLRSTYQPSVNR